MLWFQTVLYEQRMTNSQTFYKSEVDQLWTIPPDYVWTMYNIDWTFGMLPLIKKYVTVKKY